MNTKLLTAPLASSYHTNDIHQHPFKRMIRKILFLIITFVMTSTFSVKNSIASPPSVDVQFGKPTIQQNLFYEKMYEKKPFPDASLYYYGNGVYKIISPGEAHYGVYTIRGRVTDDEFEIHYISLPSTDWGEKTAHHFLRFNRKTGTFTQQATWEDDPNIPPQHGRFSQRTNSIDDPRQIQWDTHADLDQHNR